MNTLLYTYNHYKPVRMSRKSHCYAHRRSELKHIYNTIVKMGKDSPLYTFDSSERTCRYAVDIKDLAGNLRDSLYTLTEETDPETIKSNKIAVSSNPETASVVFLAPAHNATDAVEFELTVQQLASTQINTGTFLPSSRIHLAPDSYTFDIDINGLCYGFEFDVDCDDTNLSLQKKLADLINRANIGIRAGILKDENREYSALQLESHVTGKPADSSQPAIFKVSEDSRSNLPGTVKYLGLDHIEQYPSDASYLVNGEQHSSSNNTVIINNAFEITFQQASTNDNTPILIGFKTDFEAVSDTIKSFTDAYNSILDFAELYAADQNRSALLYKDISSALRQNKNSLDSIGLTILKTGRIQIDDNLLNQALTEDIPDTLQTLTGFIFLLSGICDQVFLNPMNYVNRTIVIYPNPGKAFANPYITSIYSGMLFNGYC